MHKYLTTLFGRRQRYLRVGRREAKAGLLFEDIRPALEETEVDDFLEPLELKGDELSESVASESHVEYSSSE